jgi:hypothetical protein
VGGLAEAAPKIAEHRGYLRDILGIGAEAARVMACDTLDAVRELMHTVY